VLIGAIRGFSDCFSVASSPSVSSVTGFSGTPADLEMNPPAIDLVSVSLRWAGRPVLDGVSLTVPAGSLVTILGPNGAGKSSLLRLLTGELHATSGAVRVLGTAVAELGWRDGARLRRRIGVMPQLTDSEPVVPLTVREVSGIGRTARDGAARAGDVAVIDRWLARLGLAALADRPFSRLSGGEQRRVHLARVFAQEPELILLDEPAGHLDFPAQEALVTLLAELWRETGVTIVLVTHELRHLPPGLSQVVLLREGRVVRLGPPAETLTSAGLSETYGESIEVHTHRGRWFAAMPAEP
jgi:iron complex transport system ATP-binding protein